MNNVKLIIFDLDGVLINSLNNMKYALKNTNKKLGLKLEFNKYRKYIGLPFTQILFKLKINIYTQFCYKNRDQSLSLL